MEAINLLLDNPIVLLGVMFVGALLGIAIERFVSNAERARKRAYWEKRNAARGKGNEVLRRTASLVPADAPDRAIQIAAEQLRCVMGADFQTRPLLNKPERRLLSCLDETLALEAPGWRPMGQVSLGEILSSPDEKAFFAINAKRVDLLIVDAECRPLHAVEFQGSGHHMGRNTAARDAVKREALRRAGIGYLEVVHGNTPSEVRQLVLKLIAESRAKGVMRVAHQAQLQR